MVLLTVDIGTSNFKSAIWDIEGNQRAAFAAEPLFMEGGRHEADSGQWLRAFENCCRSLGAEVPLTVIEAIVISGNGPSLVPVLEVKADSPHHPSPYIPAAPARLWLDRQSVKAAEQISALVGGFVDACFFLPKALDIKTNEQQLYEETKYFLGCPEMLAYALTGEARTVFPADGFDRWFWDDSLLECLNLDKQKFPPFLRPGEVFGGLAPRAAAHFGLRPDIPVISGGPDFFAAILGAGVVKPGQACDRAGTSEGINVCTENHINHERLMSYRHPVKPFWNLSGIVSTTGKAIEWGCDLLGLSHDDFFALAETARAGAGGLVFLPYLAGERSPVRHSAERGVLRGLSLSAGRAEFARAVLEGICFAIRDIIATMEESGAVINELRVAGTLSGSDILNRIKADITQKPVCAPRQKEAELLGLAIIGSHALGKFASFSEASNALVSIEKTFQPDKKNTTLYDDLFEKYRKMP
jgi:xylulokinase